VVANSLFITGKLERRTWIWIKETRQHNGMDKRNPGKTDIYI
jgi:hypothetical protein